MYGFIKMHVNERLQLHYGSHSSLAYQRTGEGQLAAVLSIPL